MTRSGGTPGLGERELDVMEALWELREGTVTEVQRRLDARGYEAAYTTVQTMLNRLVEKGHAMREKDGRSFRYRPALGQAAAVGRAIGGLVERFFGGSAEALAKHLVETDLDPAELDRLQRFLEEERRS